VRSERHFDRAPVLGLSLYRVVLGHRNLEREAADRNCSLEFGRFLALFLKTRWQRFLQFLKVGLGISRTNADSQWNPVYNAFHRNFCCANEKDSSVVL